MKSIHQLVIILSLGPRDDVTTIFISICSLRLTGCVLILLSITFMLSLCVKWVLFSFWFLIPDNCTFRKFHVFVQEPIHIWRLSCLFKESAVVTVSAVADPREAQGDPWPYSLAFSKKWVTRKDGSKGVCKAFHVSCSPSPDRWIRYCSVLEYN